MSRMLNELEKKNESAPPRAGYLRLREDVSLILLRGRKTAEEKVDQVKLRTYWEVGRRVDEHIQKEKNTEEARTLYGKQIIRDLSKDLHLGSSLVYDILLFARTYKIFPTSRKLGWSVYRALLSVKNPQERAELAKRAESEAWNVRNMREEKKIPFEQTRSHSEKKKSGTKFISKRGQLDAYRMDAEDSLDLGFSTFLRPDLRALNGFKEGDILQMKGGKPAKLKGATKADIYTYRAKVERVVDGDTLWLHIELGFNVRVRQKVRLRGIDAPELGTKAGEKAKRFVLAKLRNLNGIVVTTTKPDKFDRYLSDVYLSEKENAPNLNQLLLETGHARPASSLSEDVWDETNVGRF